MMDDPVPAPRTQSQHFRDPFRLLKAILIGVSLGFIAVMLRPYVKHSDDGGYRLALPAEVKEESKDKDRPPSPSAVIKDQPSERAAIQPAAPSQPRLLRRKLSSPPAPTVKEPPAVVADNEKPSSIAPAAETAPKASAPPPPAEANKPAPETNSTDMAQSPASQPPVAPASVPAFPASAPEIKPEQPPAIIPALDVTYPKPFSKIEMDEAMQPLLTFKLSALDLAVLKDVFATASRGMDVQRSAIQKISDPSARKLAEWRVLRVSQAELPVQLAFRAGNPLFPSPLLDTSAERAVFMTNVAPSDVLKFYAVRRPSTGPGKASLGAAYVAAGERDRGTRLIRQAWVRHEFDAEAEARYLKLFGSLLTEDDRVARKAFLTARGLRKEAAFRRVGLESTSAAGGRAVSRVMAQRAAVVTQAQSATVRAAALKPAKLPYRAVPAKQIYRRPLARSGRRRVETHTAGVSRYALIAPAGLVSTAAWQWPRRRAASAPIAAGGDPKAAPSPSTTPNNGTAAPDPATGIEQGSSNPQPKSSAAKSEQPAQPTKPAPQSAQQKLAGQAIKLVKEIQADSATLLARLNGLKRQKANKKLWSILRSARSETADLGDPERWWELRRDEARRVLNLGQPKTAYGIAKVHAPLDEEFASEAEFLSGWLALRSLKLPQLAKRHFQAAKDANGSPRDQARSAYWLAQAELALKQPSDAEAHLREAGRRWFAFYGGLAISSSREGELCQFRAPAKPTPEQIAEFTTLDVAKAAMIIKQLDMQPLLLSFFLDLARQIDDPAQMTLFLELAERIAPPHVAIRFAKVAIQRGFPVEAYALPVLLPKFDIAGENGTIETAVLNALTRQESEFDVSSKSPVGARGLMQLMPGTARLVAANNKMKYELGRLSTDPSYNVTLGSLYLASLLSSFDGSYVLALAAYNAGPGRVAQWMKEFGDPRTKAIDPIDWIERIPFTETRDYVQRIMESTQLYRCRIAQGKVPIQLAQDLNRGRPEAKPRDPMTPSQMVQ